MPMALSLVARLDRWADARLERVRGAPAADRLMLAASWAGDHSKVWHAVGLARGLTSDDRLHQAVWLSALIGCESLVVNQGIKRLFRRARPTEAGDVRLQVRRPSTSSFPSGHASAGFMVATVMTQWSGPVWALAWFGAAAVVGASRAYVRIHHASDVIGGAVVGAALGLAAWPLLDHLPRLW